MLIHTRALGLCITESIIKQYSERKTTIFVKAQNILATYLVHNYIYGIDPSTVYIRYRLALYKFTQLLYLLVFCLN